MGPILSTISAFGVQRICHEAATVESLAVLIGCLLLSAWSATLTATDHAGHAGHTELPAAAYSARSIYQLESVWTTATEQPLRLGQLQGKVQVLAMVYTTCESACPIIVSLMQLMEAALPPELRPDVGFVLVTFDPARIHPLSSARIAPGWASIQVLVAPLRAS